jgi:hypothetical protein
MAPVSAGLIRSSVAEVNGREPQEQEIRKSQASDGPRLTGVKGPRPLRGARSAPLTPVSRGHVF